MHRQFSSHTSFECDGFSGDTSDPVDGGAHRHTHAACVVIQSEFDRVSLSHQDMDNPRRVAVVVVFTKYSFGEVCIRAVRRYYSDRMPH